MRPRAHRNPRKSRFIETIQRWKVVPVPSEGKIRESRMTGKFGAGLALGIVGTLLAAVAGWLALAYSGAYNIAATDPHADAVRWTIHTSKHRSVATRANAAAVPEPLPEDLVAEGAVLYAESCARCHGGPGKDPSDWSRGMRPEPPHLTEAATEWQPEEIHWIVENGIKMTGMPAFAERFDTDELLALTAFVSELPGLSPDDYAALTGEPAGDATDTAAPDPETAEPARPADGE
ncbi:c-type cytochrome [Rhodobacteraceae bacterium 2CG4]|uniref:C-type cytochrome n=1 Tax=Halovulum marinum TaxID=2662447 RepID=A0A6L5Z2R8_9RHOB|nr:cytochrome c [Halovulum marinum]MSU90370.1 c-type cytochrome [Halovulum marinum]